MCNAWNHSPSCPCGFGGVGHAGRSGFGSYDWSPPSIIPSSWATSISGTYESYVNPNAVCPVCGAAVFFYRSPYGGRVFFDELGPPWPKHPCTDNGQTTTWVRAYRADPEHTGPARTYRWQDDGWQPISITVVREVDKNVLEIRGLCREKEVMMYYRLPLGCELDAFRGCLAHIRDITSSSPLPAYEISVITPSGEIASGRAYKTLSHARGDGTQRQTRTPSYHASSTANKAPKTTRVVNRPEPSPGLSQRQPPWPKETQVRSPKGKPETTGVQRGAPAQRSKPGTPAGTTMALAFAAAKQRRQG